MNVSRLRLIQLSAFLSVWALIVIARLVFVQIARHDDYVIRAAKQQERTISLNPVRGSILDARGRVLAESVAAQSIYADPQTVTDTKLTAARLAAIQELGVSAKDIEKKLKGRGEFAWIARQVSPQVAGRVKALKLPGIYMLEEHRRLYPKGSLAANILGYVSIDGEGLAGIEHSFDDRVRGKAGKVTLLRDARRGMYLVGGEGTNAPVDGKHVVLTVDEVIQYITERALQRAVESSRASGGVAVVMDPATGEILAMASWPTFDPNRFREFSPDAWRNRAVQDRYEPGSTFKIVTAAAGIENRVVTPSQVLDCGMGKIQIANVNIREHGGNKYGYMTFEDVLAESSNVGTIRVGLSLGPKRLYRTIRDFGFGSRTGIELPGEASGILRSTEKWSQLSNAVISIGQEIGATPLQILQAAATIGNGGVRVQPHILRHIVDDEGKVVYASPPPDKVRVISDRTAAVLNEMLKTVVARGTGKNAALVEHVVAGKTGTAQKAGRGGYLPDKVFSSFVGYVPADGPRLAIFVGVDEPRIGQYGGAIAAPAFKEIAEASLRYLGIGPSLPSRNVTIEPFELAMFSQSGNEAIPAATEAGEGEGGGRIASSLPTDTARPVAAEVVRREPVISTPVQSEPARRESDLAVKVNGSESVLAARWSSPRRMEQSR